MLTATVAPVKRLLQQVNVVVRHPFISAAIVFSLNTLMAGTILGAEQDFRCTSKVASHSNLEKMAEGDFSANVVWGDVHRTATSIGYGPAADRQYELTIVDGVVYMARPGEHGEAVMRTDPRPEEGAAMLQLASPEKWMLAGELPAINSFDDLNFELDNLSDENGCDDKVLLPFKIIGRANKATWSLDTAPDPLVSESENQAVTLVGLYNRNQKARYFMVRGYNLHVHVLFNELKTAGHLRNIELEAGARIYLPGG